VKGHGVEYIIKAEGENGPDLGQMDSKDTTYKPIRRQRRKERRVRHLKVRPRRDPRGGSASAPDRQIKGNISYISGPGPRSKNGEGKSADT